MRGLALGSWRERRAISVLLDWRTTSITIQISNGTAFGFELDTHAQELQYGWCFLPVSEYVLVQGLSLAPTIPLLDAERS
jgi:hypothetical protein